MDDDDDDDDDDVGDDDDDGIMLGYSGKRKLMTIEENRDKDKLHGNGDYDKIMESLYWGVGGTVDSEALLRSEGTPLSQVRVPPPARLA
ncbi:hypothetical protein PoB_007288000 [Plakobranchus ocellatus]|uniref:Uncharacterized protein n=1 Tax=Plakobranchus ocellatus TaxID=259542 RepID=A0AAV4DQE9_9GAST|nr:hypothetical protein PoB_007288000 [Plakobranchus ocellatus]